MDERESSPQGDGLDDRAARLVEALKPLYPEVEATENHGYLSVSVPVESLEAAARTLKERLEYRYLSMVTAVDWPDRIDVIYLVFALEHPRGVLLQASLPRVELPDCPSLTTVWAGADFQEREVYDLMGINFVGHPDLRRILTEDDFPGHPLRKDFGIEPDYVLMRHLRFGVEGQLKDQASRDG